MKHKAEIIIAFMTSLNSNNHVHFSIYSNVLLFLAMLCTLTACMKDSEKEGAKETDIVDPLIGAWGGQSVVKDQPVDVVVIFTPTHQVAAWYDTSTGTLVSTNGGLWSRKGIHVTERVEFHSDRPERVGTDISFDIELVNDSLSIVGSGSWLTRIDQSDQDRLEGGWQLEEGNASGASGLNAKCIRLMSSLRFQEVEYEPESGRILSTTGGSYRISGMNYTENALFSTSQETVDVPAEPFTFEREDEGWRQIGTGEEERVWKRH